MEHFFSKITELKFLPGEVPEVMSFSGYGAVFGNVDAYGDVIMAGAFSKFLADVKAGVQNWPAMLLQHGGFDLSAESMTPIGSWLHLSEDNHGLKVSGQLADTIRGRDTYALMKMQPRPALSGLSIGYITKEFIPKSKADDPKRRLTRIDLVEISPVTFAANNLARVGAIKSLDDVSERDFETALCNIGYSKRQAKTIISSGFRALSKESDSYDFAGLQAVIQSAIKQLAL